jgi:hypothetical protein
VIFIFLMLAIVGRYEDDEVGGGGDFPFDLAVLSTVEERMVRGPYLGRLPASPSPVGRCHTVSVNMAKFFSNLARAKLRLFVIKQYSRESQAKRTESENVDAITREGLLLQ